MNPKSKPVDSLSSPISLAAAALSSGGCWFLANSLSGNYWYLLWFAPIPVLLVSLHNGAKISFIIAFIAYLIGRLSWFSYLVTVASVVPAIIFTITLPLVFASIVILSRKVILQTGVWYAAFIYPALFTAFEYLLLKISSDGSAGSISYSQANVLPVIQIASVTGILGITFFASLVPSSIATGWFYRRKSVPIRKLLTVTASLSGIILLFGFIRMSNKEGAADKIAVGMVSLDESFHEISDKPNFEDAIKVAKYYANEISLLAARGAKLVVLPERSLNLNNHNDTVIIGNLSRVARQAGVYIIVGYTSFRTEKERNAALVINAHSKLVAGYNKVHLVRGLEQQFTPGDSVAVFSFNNTPAGLAICKDLDFPAYIRKYAKKKIRFLCVPAWDFIQDDWLHSRMAVLRGVENGFSEIRTARQGRLTVSDYCGRVTSEADASAGKRTVSTGSVSLTRKSTFYSIAGEDWFGILNLLSVFFLFFRRTTK